MSARRVLLVTNDLGPRAGGIETFILGLLSQLDGSDCVIYTSAQEGSEAFDQKLNQDFGVVVVRDRGKVLLPTPRVNRSVLQVMKENESEIIWFGAAMPLGWMSGYLKRNGAKRIVSLTHGHEVWWAKVRPFSWILKQSTRSIDVLTYLGEFTRKAITPSVSKNCQLVQIAPGISLEHFSPGKKSETLVSELHLNNKQVIVSVGRLVHRKGQDQLLRALPAVLAIHPDVVLIFVGVGPRRKKLDQLVTQYKVSDYVRFVGRIQYAELPAYFRLADLFVMPSRSRFAGLEVEGLGIVYLEASASGIPVIAGASGGAPDAVLDGKTGVTIDGTNVSAIADAINDLLDHPSRMQEMGAAGRLWTTENWSWNFWGARFREVLFGN